MSRQPGATVSEKHKALSTLFKALAEHASDDKARPSHLHHVRVWRVPAPTPPEPHPDCDECAAARADGAPPAPAAPDTIRFEATDGHALVRVDVPASFFDDVGFPAPDGYYMGKAAATLLSVGSAPITNPAAADEEWRWPQTDQVIPSETMAPGAACGFDPVLLASVLDTIAKIAHGFGGRKSDPVRVQFGQASVDPCRITRKIVIDAARVGFHDVVDVVAVVMPCRL